MELHHVAISVIDLEKSANFYKDILGFKEIRRYKKEGWEGEAVILRLKNVEIEIFHFNDYVNNKDDLSDFKVIGIKHIAFKVANVAEKYKELKSKGIDISEPKKGTTCSKFCFFRDPDGIPLEFYEK